MKTAWLLRLLIWWYYPFLAMVAGMLVAAIGLVFRLLVAVHWFPLVVPMLVLTALVLMGALVQVVLAFRGLWVGKAQLDDPMTIKLSQKKCPKLHELVAAVARERQLQPADEIRVAADTVAHVYEGDGGKRVLVIGAMAVTNFSRSALEGVIAHELGHFTAGDTRAMRRGLKRHVVMGLIEGGLRSHRLFGLNPFVWLIRAYHWLYGLVWAAVSRDKEFAADRKSVEQVGKEVTAAALIYLHVTERLPWVRLSSIAQASVETNRPMMQIFTEQAARAKTIDEFEWQEACRKVLEKPTEWFDTHPRLRDRLAAIGVSPRKALRLALDTSGPPVRDLLPGWSEIEEHLTSQLIAAFAAEWQAKLELRQIMVGRPLIRQ